MSQMQIEAWSDYVYLVYGPLSTKNKLPAARNEHLNKVCHINSANKQLFEIGKLNAFSAMTSDTSK